MRTNSEGKARLRGTEEGEEERERGEEGVEEV